MEKDELELAKQAFTKVVEDWGRDVKRAEQAMRSAKQRYKSAKRVYEKTFNERRRIAVIGVEHMGLSGLYVRSLVNVSYKKLYNWVAHYREHGYTDNIS